MRTLWLMGTLLLLAAPSLANTVLYAHLEADDDMVALSPRGIGNETTINRWADAASLPSCTNGSNGAAGSSPLATVATVSAGEHADGVPTNGSEPQQMPYAAQLNPDVQPVLRWQVAVQGNQPTPPMYVDVEVRDGAPAGGPGDASIEAEANPVLAVGRSAARPLIPGTAGHTAVLGANVYSFDVALNMVETTFGARGTFHVIVDVRMDGPCDGAQAPMMGVHSSPGLRPGLQFEVVNPIQFAYLHPQFLGDEFVVHAGGITPWGTQDVGSFEAWLESADGTRTRTLDAAPHNRNPATPTGIASFVMPRSDMEGSERVVVRVTNQNETAEMTSDVDWIVPQDVQDAPSAGLLLTLCVLVGMAVSVARRR